MVIIMKKENKNRNKNAGRLNEATEYIVDDPETPYEMVNKYGTYEIQPTAETEKAFPTIAQGLPKNAKKPSISRTRNPKKNSI